MNTIFVFELSLKKGLATDTQINTDFYFACGKKAAAELERKTNVFNPC